VRHNVASAYITAAAAYGWQDITTERLVTVAGVDRLRAEFNANSYSARIEAGNHFVTPWIGGVGLTPYAAAQVTAFELPSYAETANGGTGTFALAYNGKTTTATRTELGVRSDKSFPMNDTMLTLRGRAAWAHDFDTDRSIAATLVAARREFHRERRRAGRRCRTDHGVGRSDLDEWLGGGRDLRRRVLGCHRKLQRQGRGALRMVIGSGLPATGQGTGDRHFCPWSRLRLLQIRRAMCFKRREMAVVSFP
jgi:hypothetical protein